MKGFVISWFYPPINSSEGLVTYKLLNRSKVEHDVFTQQGNTHWSYKKEHSLQSPHIKTIFGESESYEKWIESCIEYFDKHYKEYDFIMSRAMPPESHIVAQKIKQKYPHIKWIASFGDPIYNSPYDGVFNSIDLFNYPVSTPKEYMIRYLKRPIKKTLVSYQKRNDRRLSRFLKDLEYKTLSSADVIIFNNEYQKKFMLGQHKLGKIQSIVLPHSYEKDFYKKSRVDSQDKFKIVHTGHLDHLRTPLPLLEAINRIKEKRPELYQKIDLSFYGTFDDRSKIYIVDKRLFDVVHIQKPIDYFDSLGVVKTSDLCLVIDANFSRKFESNIYFAAKTVDYLGAGTPILAITMPEGISADVIRATGNQLSSHSVDEIYSKLVMILEGTLKFTPNISEYKKYDAKTIAKSYDSMLNKLIK